MTNSENIGNIELGTMWLLILIEPFSKKIYISMEKDEYIEIVFPKIFQKFWKMFGLTFIDYATISFYVWLRLGEIYYHRIVFELSLAFLNPLPSFIKMQLGAILTTTLQLHIHALCFFLSMPVFCLTHFSLILHFYTLGNVRKPKVSWRFEWV